MSLVHNAFVVNSILFYIFFYIIGTTDILNQIGTDFWPGIIVAVLGFSLAIVELITVLGVAIKILGGLAKWSVE